MRIYLHSVVGTDVEDTVLFRHWIEHYLRLGIDKGGFRLVLHAKEKSSPGPEAFRKILSSYGIDARALPMFGEFDDSRKHIYSTQCKQTFAGETDWIVVADTDEFHQYPGPLPAFLRSADEQGYYAIQSRLVDRFASNYRPGKLRLEKPIEDQFPKSLAFTETILRGCATKIVAHKMTVLPREGGNHRIWPDEETEVRDPKIRRRRDVSVHHYKWTEGVDHGLAKSAEHLKRLGVEWNAEPRRALDYLEAHRSFRPSWDYYRTRIHDRYKKTKQRLDPRNRQSGPPDPAAASKLAPSCTAWLRKHLSGREEAFLFGGGDTTASLAPFCRSILSLQHDPLQFRALAAWASGAPNVTLKRATLDEDGDYCREIAAGGRRFDLVVIDGRDRNHCVTQALGHLREKGLLVLNHVDCRRYAPAVARLQEAGFDELRLEDLCEGGWRLATGVFYRRAAWEKGLSHGD